MATEVYPEEEKAEKTMFESIEELKTKLKDMQLTMLHKVKRQQSISAIYRTESLKLLDEDSERYFATTDDIQLHYELEKGITQLGKEMVVVFNVLVQYIACCKFCPYALIEQRTCLTTACMSWTVADVGHEQAGCLALRKYWTPNDFLEKKYFDKR